jgi:ferritin-like metal-binding protein YciE
MKTTKNTNTDLLQMTEAQLERVVEYYEIRSFAVILTEAETVRQNEAKQLLNNI